jgi:hypothetical protein
VQMTCSLARCGKINPIEGLITMGKSGIQVAVMSKRPQRHIFLSK